MILVLNLGFLLIGLILLTIFIKQFNNLKDEIEFLPNGNSFKRPQMNYPLIGEEISKFIPNEIKSIIPTNKETILVITSKHCPYCPEYFSKFIDANHSKSKSFVKIELNREISKIQISDSEYKGMTFKNISVTNLTIKKLEIEGFPSYVVLDPNGLIVDYLQYTRGVIKKYIEKDSLKQKAI